MLNKPGGEFFLSERELSDCTLPLGLCDMLGIEELPTVGDELPRLSIFEGEEN